MKSDKKAPLLTGPLLMFMGTMILANIAYQMHQTLMPLYIESLGAQMTEVGIFFTLGAIAPLAFQILGGWLSDSLGRLQAIAIGSTAGVIGYLVYIFAPSWQWLLISTVTTAMAVSFVSPSFQAFIAEQSTEETRGRVYGITQSLYMIVGIVGPIVGGYLSDDFGYKEMFIIAAMLYGVATVIRVLMARSVQKQPETQTHKKPSFLGLKRDMRAIVAMLLTGGLLTWIFISDGVRDIAYGLAFQFEPIYMQDFGGLSNTQIGLLSSIGSVAVMLLMMPAGLLSDKKGERIGIVGGFVAVVLGILVFLRSMTFASFAVSWVLFGVGNALVGPAYSSLISKAVPENLRGTAFGLFSTSIGFISLPAPYIGALLWERFGPQVPFYVPVVATVLMLPVMWVKFKLPKPESAPQAKTVVEEAASA